jgi:hypothetical protein
MCTHSSSQARWAIACSGECGDQERGIGRTVLSAGGNGLLRGIFPVSVTCVEESEFECGLHSGVNQAEAGSRLLQWILVPAIGLD